MDWLAEIVEQIELHLPQGIRNCFAKGVSPDCTYRGQPLLMELVSGYGRGTGFKACMQVFAEAGVLVEDETLFAVLLDDADGLEVLLNANPSVIHRKYSFKCAYTPMLEAGLLHISAEFNHVNAARILYSFGADVNAPAGIDEQGFGGQTPIFHTVNQNGNQSLEMLHFLLAHGADTTLTVPGLIWGKGYEWETFIPAVNPLSYTMMGLLPQMHRNETTISQVVSLLLERSFGIRYIPPNVPCAYLRK